MFQGESGTYLNVKDIKIDSFLVSTYAWNFIFFGPSNDFDILITKFNRMFKWELRKLIFICGEYLVEIGVCYNV